MTKPFILVVEGDPRMRDRYQDVFRGYENKFDYHAVPSAGAAEWFLQRKPADLVVLSSTPLGIAGMDLLWQLRNAQATKNVPVIFVSTKEDLEEKIRALRAGADLYQTTSFNAGVFIAQIERLLDRRPIERRFSGLANAFLLLGHLLNRVVG
jgi:two-component system OmpR family response regulator